MTAPRGLGAGGFSPGGSYERDRAGSLTDRTPVGVRPRRGLDPGRRRADPRSRRRQRALESASELALLPRRGSLARPERSNRV